MSGDITFEKSVDDLIGTYRDWFWANLRRKPIVRIARLAVVVAMLLLNGWQLDDYREGAGAPLFGAAGGFILVIPICWILTYALLPRRAHRTYVQQRTLDPNCTWNWSEDGLASTSGNGNNYYRWSEFHAWHEGRHAILFFLTDNHVLYVARRVLSDDQVADLIRIARHARIPTF